MSLLRRILDRLGRPFIGRMPQVLSAANSRTVTSSDASPGTPWVGEWERTRSKGYVRQIVVLSSATSATPGTLTFEYGEDGSTATISEARTITDFATVRDFDLLNAGEFFRVKFEPDNALGGTTVNVTTTHRTQNDGAFVRLASQEIEEANAAMGQQFAYIKAFIEATGKSTNIRANSTGNLLVADFLTEVAKGNITGHSLAQIAGRNPAVAASTEEFLWFASAVPYTGWLQSAIAVRVKAGGNANDTAAGTGCQSVKITGLDASFLEVSETVATAGALASSATTQTFIRILNVEAVDVGSYTAPYPAADISIETTGGVLLATIEAERGVSQVGGYTIPAAKTGYLTQCSATVDGSKAADVFFSVREDADDVSTPFTSRQTIWQFNKVSGQARETFRQPLGPIPAKSDVWVSAIGPSGGAAVGGNFALLLVDD